MLSDTRQIVTADREQPISEALSAFLFALQPDRIPAAVLERARYLILDAVGIAHASTHYEFARCSLSAIQELSGQDGRTPVIGLVARLSPRDAMLMNGILIHGLDYDDTHAAGVIHATASTFPCALGTAASAGLDAQAMLTAYVCGMEVAARLASVAKGGFHQVGFHPTGLIGAFACAIVSGKLLGLGPAQLAAAQGIALSVGSGSMEFLQDGAWTKRMHPGWAAAAGLTCATLARHSFQGPKHPYEGRFGLFNSYLGAWVEHSDLTLATAGLGETWELPKVNIKPLPACHFTHAAADAAAHLRERHGLAGQDIRSVRVLVPAEVVKTVCEPVATKKRPQNSYDAQFSIPYIVATALLRGRFGLADLEDAALGDEHVLALASRVEYEVDPRSPFPKYYSGEVIVTLADGREIRHREQVNRGGEDRPISNDDIARKFHENMALVTDSARADRVRELVLSIGPGMTVRSLQQSLAAAGG